MLIGIRLEAIAIRLIFEVVILIRRREQIQAHVFRHGFAISG